VELVVDLHTHSHFSRATSPQCTLEGLYYWGKLKGINIVGTGDFTHPTWFAEMQGKLEPAEAGLFKLKDESAALVNASLPASVRGNLLRFVLTAEIATVYPKGGKVRKLHQLIVAPSFATVAAINARLARLGGNLSSDGRPILLLDSKELLKIVLDTGPESLFIPAHIWTPWFGLLGSKSGFDSLAEAYDELTPHIHAIETGLSSDPAMNWRVPDLDGVTISSHSDAHSPQKLGREASVVQAQVNYRDIIGAFKTNDQRFIGTIEFFPQEGKYHLDGHRKCKVRFTPEQTKAHGGICPVCHRRLVVGVLYRVDELAKRPPGYVPATPKRTEYIIPLPEIVAELKGVRTVTSKAVVDECTRVYQTLGDEFTILRKLPTRHIRTAGFAPLARAVERIRAGQVVIEPGYDGVYGTVKIFHDAGELSRIAG
jgi:DNA helicase II / ATP-dependent DNA helicase PcrA